MLPDSILYSTLARPHPEQSPDYIPSLKPSSTSPCYMASRNLHQSSGPGLDQETLLGLLQLSLVPVAHQKCPLVLPLSWATHLGMATA